MTYVPKKRPPEKRPPSLTVTVPPELHQRALDYAHKHGTPYARVVRAVIEAVPFDDDTIVPVVLKLPKGAADDPQKLKVWLSEAMADIEAYFAE